MTESKQPIHLITSLERRRRWHPEEKWAIRARTVRCTPSRFNEEWALDFVHDNLTNGRRIRFLAVLDTFSRECLRIDAGSSIRGQDVADAFSGKPLSEELLELLHNRGGRFTRFWRPSGVAELAQIKAAVASHNLQIGYESGQLHVEYAQPI